MNTTTAAQSLLTDTRFRFTIRQIGKGDLRKGMTASRYLLKRDEYASRSGMRVDVLDATTNETQTWDLYLTKPFWA